VLTAFGFLVRMAVTQRDRVRDISQFLFGSDGQDGFAKRVDHALKTVEQIPREMVGVVQRAEEMEERFTEAEKARELRFDQREEELRRLFREANLRERRR
jgi:hypothetical protein